MTKRSPLSMCILDKRICIVGMRNHAFTAINFKNDMKMSGTTWNGDNNDWIQVFTNMENNGFYRVWEKENMTLTTLRNFGPSAPKDKVDFNWQNDHVVKRDLMILGEVKTSQILIYDYTDKQLLVYDQNTLAEQYVKMVITPVPKTI